MNSLKNYSLTLSESEYHALDAWSHSMIARYAREGFSCLSTIHKPVEETESMRFGSLVDAILTHEGKAGDEYIVDTTETSCPPAEKEVFDKIISLGFGEYSYDNLAGMCMGSLTEIMHSCETFCSKYKKEETRFAKLYEASAYYELRRKGKKVVSKKDWDDAVEMASAIKSNPLLKSIFGTGTIGDVEYIYQSKFTSNVTLPNNKTVTVKIMPDVLVVNHKDKTVQPVDLKTSSMPAHQFYENFIKYRYDLQASVYTDILQDVLNRDIDYFDYRILPYLFADISRTDKVPVTYTYDPRSETQANGFTYFTSTGFQVSYPGWKQLLSEMTTYEDRQAVVPDYIKVDEPNDILSILSIKR